MTPASLTWKPVNRAVSARLGESCAEGAVTVMPCADSAHPARLKVLLSVLVRREIIHRDRAADHITNEKPSTSRNNTHISKPYVVSCAVSGGLHTFVFPTNTSASLWASLVPAYSSVSPHMTSCYQWVHTQEQTWMRPWDSSGHSRSTPFILQISIKSLWLTCPNIEWIPMADAWPDP